MRRAAAAGMLVALLGCGEPPVDLHVPARAPDQVVLDEAAILTQDVASRLHELDADVVALTFQSPEASLGHADRAGRTVLEAWQADVVLVAVARPGDFDSGDDDRRRFFGLVPADRLRVGRDARERIVEEVVPPLAARNDWPAAFLAAIDVLEEELE
jgi:hypothetical protein